MLMHVRWLVPLLFVSLVLTGPAHATVSASRQARIAAAADAAVAAGVPGVVVYSRLRNQTTLLARGVDNLDTKRPMTTSDRFRVGSVTKMFVATVVMQLVQERKVGLDDSIEKQLPGL